MNSEFDKLTLRYYTNKNLNISKDLYVYPLKHYFNSNSNDLILTSLNCKNCGNSFSNNLPNDLKIFSNFNYDYKESMDILTCHESCDPINIDSLKLLKLLNLKDFKLCLFYEFIQNNSSYDNSTIYHCKKCHLSLVSYKL